jgi:hypothetical protein
MARRASEWIPHNIRAAARRSGLSLPLWYVGRSNGHEPHNRRVTVEKIIQQVEAEEHAEQTEAPQGAAADGYGAEVSSDEPVGPGSPPSAGGGFWFAFRRRLRGLRRATSRDG